MDPDARYVTIFDCALLETAGARARLWRGPLDPDPIVVRITAVPLYLTPPFELGTRAQHLLRPLDRTGQQIALDPVFIEATGITEAIIARDGMNVPEALLALDRLSGGGRLLSWGKDELHLMAIGCYAAGFQPLIPVGRFGSAATLLHKSGIPLDEIHGTSGYKAAELCGLPPDPGDTDAAISMAHALQEALRRGALSAQDVLKG